MTTLGFNVGFIGLGNMGGSLVSGLLVGGVPPAEIYGYDPSPGRADALGCTSSPSLNALLDAADCVVVCVKPHLVGGVLQAVSAHGGNPIVVSVAAGIELATLSAAVPGARAVARAMPNTAARVGASTTALVAAPGTPASAVANASALFERVGSVIALDREELMHIATAVVGSGPAFVYVLAEALADGAVAGGMPRPLARHAVTGMLRGAAALLAEHDGSPAELKDQVASPGGTTIAGLRALEAHGFRDATIEAVLGAARRSEEMA